MSEKKIETDQVSGAGRVDLPAGLRVVVVRASGQSELLHGDPDHDTLNREALPALLLKGYSVAFILTLRDAGGTCHFFLKPPEVSVSAA